MEWTRVKILPIALKGYILNPIHYTKKMMTSHD